MAKIGLVICARQKECGGAKCLRSMRERRGAFAAYPADEPLEIVGYSTCGGCPGGNVEYVPAEMERHGAEAIHLATGLVVGTHPVPEKYRKVHEQLPFWKEHGMAELAGPLRNEDTAIQNACD